MSTPSRRRRIAGETKPGDVAPKTSIVKKAAKLRPPTPKTRPPKPAASTPAASKPAPPPEAPPRPAAPVDQPAAESRTRRLTLPRLSGQFAILAAVTVVAVVFGVVFGIRGVTKWNNDSGIVEAHEKAATTAASAGETIFTYQYNKLPAHLRDSKALMTKPFAKKFEKIAPALQELAPQRKIQVKATVRNASATECGDACSADKATVLVFIDQARVADGSTKPTVFGNRIELMMVKQDGRWLVNNIKAL